MSVKPDFITKEEAAEILNVAMEAYGEKLAAYKVHGSALYTEEDVANMNRYLELAQRWDEAIDRSRK